MKEFFKDIASEEKKNIDYKLLSRQILTPLKKSFSFLQKHGNLYNFWINVLDHKSSDKVKLQQVRFFKELFNKGIIKSDSDQSDIEYEESIGERTKSRKQRSDKIKEKEQNINNKLFKKYFYHQSPSNIYNALSNPKNTKKHDIQVNLIKSGLID